MDSMHIMEARPGPGSVSSGVRSRLSVYHRPRPPLLRPAQRSHIPKPRITSARQLLETAATCADGYELTAGLFFDGDIAGTGRSGWSTPGVLGRSGGAAG